MCQTITKDKIKGGSYQLPRQAAERRNLQFLKRKNLFKIINRASKEINLKRETYMEGKRTKLQGNLI